MRVIVIGMFHSWSACTGGAWTIVGSNVQFLKGFGKVAAWKDKDGDLIVAKVENVRAAVEEVSEEVGEEAAAEDSKEEKEE